MERKEMQITIRMSGLTENMKFKTYLGMVNINIKKGDRVIRFPFMGKFKGGSSRLGYILLTPPPIA